MPDDFARPPRPDPMPDHARTAAEHPFAQYVRTLGRGPGRSRALTREEAHTALRMVLQGEADPMQVGAFLMLLRYRGEDPAEMAGLVEAARDQIHQDWGGPGLPPGSAPVALDWPSYGAGRTRGAPWFLLAALTLARAGHRVLMHGSNEFTRGTPVTESLAALGLPVCTSRDQAARQLDTAAFAYVPLAALCPGLDRLLRLRGLLGLRSPINTAARLLNPADAPAGVDGVFHPPYIALHVRTAALLGHCRLIVVKGGGGEAERNPAKPMAATLYDRTADDREIALPPLPPSSLPAPSLPAPSLLAPSLLADDPAGSPNDLVAAWRSGVGPGAATAKATVALGLLALGVAASAEQADAAAAELWARRLA